MLQTPVPFPFAGSKGFVAGSCDPCTVIRRNDDGTCLVRIDPRPHRAANRDASGNRTLAAGELHETEKSAFEATLATASSSRQAVGRKSTKSRRKGRAK